MVAFHKQGAFDNPTHHLNKAEFDLVKNKACPGSWKGERVSYGLLKSLLEVVEVTVREEGGRQDQLIREKPRNFRPKHCFIQNI